jgi:hypothetical protein
VCVGSQEGETGGIAGCRWFRCGKEGGNIYLDIDVTTGFEVSGTRDGTATTNTIATIDYLSSGPLSWPNIHPQ